MDKLSDFLETYGSAKLAQDLKVSRAAVSHWRHKRFRVPAERCIDIETLSNGAVSRYDLRPDVFGTAPEQAA
jgi:DNA-binding transcriptional regulator YdaS (Cro superfamily)